MNLKILKSKKIMLIVTSIIVILFALGITIYFIQNNENKETSTQPANIDEETIGNEEFNEFQNQIENNIVDEAVENNENNSITTQTQNTNTNTNKNQIPYYIKVNYGAQVVTIYKKDNQGNYTIPVKAMVCSTGIATPKSGVYSIPTRYRWLVLEGYVYGQYSIQIVGNIFFHSVPYVRKNDPSSLEYWEYDKLGTYASAGCVRLTVADVLWIYNNCANGTKVEFYSSSDPGPLGKPSAKKISSYPDYLRNWDPTDPNQSNPWRNYKEPVVEEKQPEQVPDNETEENPDKETEKEPNEEQNREPDKEEEKDPDKEQEQEPNKEPEKEPNKEQEENKNQTEEQNKVENK